MIRINILVEGPTEESFIKGVLAPALWHRDIYLAPIVLGVPGHKGGKVNYARVRRDIILQLKQDSQALCSTMFDLYGLGSGFPGTPQPTNLTGGEKATSIELAIRRDLWTAHPELRPDLRFFPYLQAYEFEGLLFSDVEAFAYALGSPTLIPQLQAIRESVAGPEEINDHPDTAPSKRILSLYPSYKKVIEGTLAAQHIGLQKMRDECPHFNSWVGMLESLTA